ncbi:MAG: hypothetical protein U9R19_16030 [Bacteroidota bacterium]|nr:hypothetical protein [Bacteroidota bacterium]
MKKTVLVTVAFLIVFAFQLSAQEKDTIRIKIGTKKILIIEEIGENVEGIDIHIDSLDNDYDFDFDEFSKEEESENEFEGHWHGFEFGFNGLLNADYEMPGTDNPMAINNARSWTFGINLFQKDIPLIKENFGLIGGLGMQFRNYHFENNYPMKNNDGNLDWIVADDKDYSKNRLQATYLTGVLAMEFQAPVGNKDHEFFLMAGAYGNFRMGSNLMQKWEEDGKKQKDKIKDDFYLNDLEYGLTGRIGIGKINLFANYSLTPLFKEGKAPEWNPVTVGIMIVGF